MSRRTHRLFVFIAITVAVLEVLVIGGVAISRVPYAHVDALAAELELRTVGELVAEEHDGAWVFMGPGPHYQAIVNGSDAYEELSARLLDIGYQKEWDDSGCAGWSRQVGPDQGSALICSVDPGDSKHLGGSVHPVPDGGVYLEIRN